MSKALWLDGVTGYMQEGVGKSLLVSAPRGVGATYFP